MDDASESKRGDEITAGRAAARTYPVTTLDRSPGKGRGGATVPAGEPSRSFLFPAHISGSRSPRGPLKDGLQPSGMK